MGEKKKGDTNDGREESCDHTATHNSLSLFGIIEK
jgi:hypothetical protein